MSTEKNFEKVKQIDRLIEYFQTKGVLNNTTIENYMGFSKGFINKQKQREGQLGTKTVTIINQKCPDLNPEWLLYGQGSMLRADTLAPALPPTPTPTKLTNEALLMDLLERVQRLERQMDQLQTKYGVSAYAETEGNVTGTHGI